MKQVVYLDHAASTPILPSSLEVLKNTFETTHANPYAQHRLGKDSYNLIEEARRNFIREGKSKDFNFIFTSSATESNNLIVNSLDLSEDDVVLCSSADHASLSRPIKSKNIKTVEIPYLVCGNIDKNELLKVCNDNKFKAFLISHVNGQSGVLNDVSDVISQLKNKNPGIHVHYDCAQSFGKIPFDLNILMADSASVSAHKLGGPIGIGGLYFRSNFEISPILLGGGHEFGLRSSTPSLPLILSFWEALRWNIENQGSLIKVREHQVNKIKDQLIKISSRVKFPFKSKFPYIFNVLIQDIPSDMFLRYLEMENVIVSSTSACNSKSKSENIVLKTLGLTKKDQKSILRISMGHNTTDDDIDLFIKGFKKTFEILDRLI